MRRFALSLVFSLAGFAAEAATSRGDFRAGYDAMMRQEYDKAIALFTSAIERGDLSRPNQALAFHYRGAEYLKKNQLAEAIRDLDNALRIDPKLATAYNDRAIAYRRQGQYGRAIDDYGQAIRLSEVPPVSWTPEHLCSRSPSWPESTHPSRLSSGVR